MKNGKQIYLVTVSIILEYTIEARSKEIAEAIAETIARFQMADEKKITAVVAHAGLQREP